MKYKIALTRSAEGVSVSVPGLPGCWSQGATEKEAIANVSEAIHEYLVVRDELVQGAEIREVEVAQALPKLPGVNHLDAVRALGKAGFRCATMNFLMSLIAVLVVASGAAQPAIAQPAGRGSDSTEAQREVARLACRALPMRLQAYAGGAGEYEIHRDPVTGRDCTYRYGVAKPIGLIVDGRLYCPDSLSAKTGDWSHAWPVIDRLDIASIEVTKDSVAMSRVHCHFALKGLVSIVTKKRR